MSRLAAGIAQRPFESLVLSLYQTEQIVHKLAMARQFEQITIKTYQLTGTGQRQITLPPLLAAPISLKIFIYKKAGKRRQRGSECDLRQQIRVVQVVDSSEVRVDGHGGQLLEDGSRSDTDLKSGRFTRERENSTEKFNYYERG